MDDTSQTACINSKNQETAITSKLMFSTMVGNPHNRSNRALFDGLVGIWIFVKKIFVLQALKNRSHVVANLPPAKINGDVQRHDIMIVNVLPAVWSPLKYTITLTTIQLDSANFQIINSI